MIIFVYAVHNDQSISQSLGASDYSYFFVMKIFRPVIERLGRLVFIKDVTEVDTLYAEAQRRNESAILFCFSPPHKTLIPALCPTVPIFAWEYSSIPNESWGADWRNNWAQVLSQLSGAITHSEYTVAAVQQELGSAYAVASLPAPLWDTYTTLARYRRRVVRRRRCYIKLDNVVVLDSQLHGTNVDFATPRPSFEPQEHRVTLEGVIYTAVFNPNDGRKNWHDLISAFCFAFQDNPNVTLLLKLIHHDPELGCGPIWHEMKKLSPYRCRVVAIQGYLESATYRTLVANTTYVVNSAYGEGQCLPLMEFMSAGKPAIAPSHTAIADYIKEHNAFIVRSSREWTHWCHDSRMVLRTFRYRIDWESLRDAFIESYRVATEQPEQYVQMSKSANNSLHGHCSQAVIEKRLSHFLERLGCKREARLPALLKALSRRAAHLIRS